MPYQSFFSGSQAPAAPSKGGGYTSFFGTPTIQGPSQAQLAQSRLANSINNMQSLKPEDQVRLINQGIKAGIVDRTKGSQAVMQALNSRQPVKVKLNPFEKAVNFGAGLGKSLYQSTVQPVVNKTESQVKYLSGPTSTQSQRDQIMNNQKTAAQNPAYQKLIKGYANKGIGVSDIVKAQQMASNGTKTSDIKAFLDKSAKNYATNEKRGLGTALSVASLAVGGGELAGVRSIAGATKAVLPTTITGGVGGGGGTLAMNPNAKGKDIAKNVAFGATGGAVLPLAGGAVASKLGRDEATKALINQSKMAGALDKARTSNAMGKLAVDEAKTTRIPVTEATPPTSIPVKDMGTKTVGKVTTATDKQYLTKSNQLTTAYNKEMESIKNLPPVTQKILQGKLDTKYSALQESLDNNYGKTNVSFNGRSTATATNGTKLPGSVMDEPAAFTPRTAPIKVDTAKVNTPTAKPPKTPSVSAADSTGLKPSGSAIRTQAAAIEKGMSEEEALTGATFRGVSHKEQAVKAAQLVNEDPEKAMDIAMGRARGDNVSHEAAVYHAVKNTEIDRALKTGDWSTVQDLANSGRHTAVSEHAQALGAEGYNTNPHDPVAIMNDLAQTRAKTLGKSVASTVNKETKTVETAVKAATPKISKMDWHTFVESIKC